MSRRLPRHTFIDVSPVLPSVMPMIDISRRLMPPHCRHTLSARAMQPVNTIFLRQFR